MQPSKGQENFKNSVQVIEFQNYKTVCNLDSLIMLSFDTSYDTEKLLGDFQL